MLEATPNVNGSLSWNCRLPEVLSKGDAPEVGSFPVRRVGLEQEFFLVDQGGALCDLADPFLSRCQEAARAEGVDPRCFQSECVKSLVEITTPPSSGFADMAKVHESCRRLNEQVSTLNRKYNKTLPEGAPGKRLANVVPIRDSTVISGGGE